MNEQEEIFQAGDQAIRAGLMAVGQVGERIAQKSAEKAQQAREADENAARLADRARVEAERVERDQARQLEQAQREQARQLEQAQREQARQLEQAQREQARQLERAQIAGDRQIDVAIGVARDQVKRDGWWVSADGNRVATQFSLLQTLDNDPRAADARDVMRDRIRELYGIDTDAIAAKHPTSPLDQHNALTNAIDDWRAAQREDALADEERSQPAEESVSAEAQTESAHERAEAAEEHEARADQLRDESAAELTQAGRFEAEQHQDYTADVAAAKEAKTAAGKARAESAAGYPKSAKQTLNESRKKGSPKARVNRSRQVKAGAELTR